MTHDFSAMSAAVQSWIDRDFLVGASSAVLVDGEVVDVRHWGHASREAGTVMSDEVIFRIFSNTKWVTSVAAMLLVEAIPEAVTRKILERTTVPVIGIGAGQECHGQILVAHDLLGLSDWQPGFAKPEASIGEQIRDTVVGWTRKVADRTSSDHRYEMRPGEADRFLQERASFEGASEETAR